MTMRQKGKLFIVSFMFLSCCMALPPDRGALFKNGKTEWVIHVQEKASSVEYRAANELHDYLEKISGCKFPVIHSTKVPAKNAIVIGSLQNKQIKALIGKLKLSNTDGENIAIYTLNGNLYLAGNTPRASLYAVYTFLRDIMGVRWLWPGKSGEFVLEKKEFVLNDLSINQKSGFNYRGFHLIKNKNDVDAQTWLSRNRSNIVRSDAQNSVGNSLQVRKAKGFYISYSGHFVSLNKELINKHPEYFAEINGHKVADQVCYSNPKVDELIIAKLIAFCRLHPEVEILQAFPADNMYYCQCKNCRQNDISTNWFGFYKRIINGVKKIYPAMKFAGLAYQGYSKTPHTDLTDSGIDFIEYCSLERCDSHLNCEINKKSIETISKWQQKGIAIGAYGYDFDHFYPYVYTATQKNIDLLLKKYHSMGLISVVPEVVVSVNKNLPKEEQLWDCNRLPIYVYATLLWNPELKLEDIIKDFCIHAYGPAADIMNNYHSLMQELWNAQDAHLTAIFVSPMPTAEKIFKDAKQMTRIKNMFLAAKTKLENEKGQKKFEFYYQNVNFDEKVFRRWIEMYNKYQSSKNNNVINVPFSSDTSFNDAIKLPSFTKRKTAKGEVPDTDTKLYFDDDALYIRSICYDKDIEKIKVKYNKHDQSVWNDECLEIFIKNPNNTVGLYNHLAVNAENAKYDSIVHGGGADYDKSWNPDWVTTVEINKTNWTVLIKLPFKSLGGVPKEGESWGFSIKRSVGSRKDIANSGFPDASYHNPNSFGMLYFSKKKIEKKLSFLIPSKYKEKYSGTMIELKEKLSKDNWGVNIIYEGAELDDSMLDADVICIKYPVNQKLIQYYNKKIIPAIKKGKILIYSGDSKSQLDKIVGDPSFELEWSGYAYDPARKTVFIAPGDWSKTPGNLLKNMGKRPTPSSGYKPVKPDGWNILASLRMANGEEFPYILTKKLGAGTVVVTTFEMGMGGGYALGGSKNIDSVVSLIENLEKLYSEK